MKIAICDDDKSDSKNMLEAIEEAMHQKQIDGKISIFHSGEALLLAIEKGYFSICFLDIYMEGMSGIETAKAIRSIQENMAIVFMTVSLEHMMDSYDIGALHYLVKPYDTNKVVIALERCMQYIGYVERYAEFKISRQMVRVFLSDIRYVEFQDKYSMVCTEQEVYRVFMRLDNMMDSLDDVRFLRCHRSFIVNMDYVIAIRGYDFILTGEKNIPIRRGNKAAIKREYEIYRFEKTRRRYKR